MQKKKTYFGKTALYGVLSAALYCAVFTYSDTIMPYFTAGSYLAALPIATVFVFSFAHGAFASNLWSALGIEAVRPQPQVAIRPAVAKRPVQRQRPRARLHV